MSGKAAKQARRLAEKISYKQQRPLAFEFKALINRLKFKDRLQIAWRIVLGRF